MLACQTRYQSSDDRRNEVAAIASRNACTRRDPVIGRGRDGCRITQA